MMLLDDTAGACRLWREKVLLLRKLEKRAVTHLLFGWKCCARSVFPPTQGLKKTQGKYSSIDLLPIIWNSLPIYHLHMLFKTVVE